MNGNSRDSLVTFLEIIAANFGGLYEQTGAELRLFFVLFSLH